MDENKIATQLESTKSMIAALLENIDENYIFDGEDIKRLRKMLGDIRMIEHKAMIRQNTFESAILQEVHRQEKVVCRTGGRKSFKKLSMRLWRCYGLEYLFKTEASFL